MTPETAAALQEIGGVLGATAMAAYLAWKARGRKELTTPFAPDHDDQPRVISRGEWHRVVNLVNGLPSISERGRRNEARLNALEATFSEHLKATARAMDSFTRLEASFAAHQDRWEEVGVEARDHRQRLEAHILRLEAKVDGKTGH